MPAIRVYRESHMFHLDSHSAIILLSAFSLLVWVVTLRKLSSSRARAWFLSCSFIFTPLLPLVVYAVGGDKIELFTFFSSPYNWLELSALSFFGGGLLAHLGRVVGRQKDFPRSIKINWSLTNIFYLLLIVSLPTVWR